MTVVRTATVVALAITVAACEPEATAQPTPSASATSGGGGSGGLSSAPASRRPPVPSGAASPPAGPGGLTSATFRTTLPAMPGLVSVRDMGPIQQNARVAGRDGGQSTRYGDTSVWIFNDTTFKDPWGFVSNTTAATRDLDASDGIDLRSSNGVTIDNAATPVETVPRTDAEKAFERAHAAPAGGCKGSSEQYCGAIFGFWPGPIIADPARHRVLFTYGKLCRGGQDGTPCSGSLGKGLGLGIAAIDMGSGTVTRLEVAGGAVATSVEGRDPTVFFPPGSRQAGGNAALVVDDYAYLYGQCDYFDCALARVRLAEVQDVKAWRWYDGSGWVADAAAAKKTGAQPGAAGNTVFYSAGLKGYVDVYMPYGSNEVWYRIGGSPFGPWSGGVKLLVTAGDKARPNYALFGHPEFAQQDGRVQYLSYFNGRTGAQQLIRWELKV